MNAKKESGGVETNHIPDGADFPSPQRESRTNFSAAERRGAGVRRGRRGTGTPGGPEEEGRASRENRAGDDGAGALFPDVSQSSCAIQVGMCPECLFFDRTFPNVQGNARRLHGTDMSSSTLHGVKDLTLVFAMASDSSHDGKVANPELSLRYLETRHGKDVVAAHARARLMLVVSLQGKRDQDILL